MSSSGPLSDADVRAYRRDGFHFPIDVFEAEETAVWYDEIVDLAGGRFADHPAPWVQKSYLLAPSLDRLIRDRRLTDAVASVLGDDMLALSADLFVKPARSKGQVTWHQDVNYWQLDPLDMLTAWVALSPADAGTGCMQYASGRHHARIEHVERPDEANMLSRGQELAVSVGADDCVDVVLAPGEVAFHHALTPHASGPNRSDTTRIGFAIRYAPTSVRQTGGPPISARLVRGDDRFGHFELERGPDALGSHAARVAHLRALAPHEATRYSTV